MEGSISIARAPQLNSSIRRKIIKTRSHFPINKAASKLIWLTLRNITAEWSRATREWKAAINQKHTVTDIRV